ncbi:MAG: hypothetical protein WC223_13670 [Bacteroidales bacterium]|jgi:hypothetical protein
MENKKTDIEIKGINSDLLIYFEILCKKTNTSIRNEIITFIDSRVNEALKKNIISPKDKDNYKIEIEEY